MESMPEEFVFFSKKTKVTEYQAAGVSTLLYKYVDSVLSKHQDPWQIPSIKADVKSRHLMEGQYPNQFNEYRSYHQTWPLSMDNTYFLHEKWKHYEANPVFWTQWRNKNNGCFVNSVGNNRSVLNKNKTRYT